MLEQHDTDLVGLIHKLYMDFHPNDYKHSGLIYKFSRSIDTLHKNDLGKNLMNGYKKHTKKLSIDQTMIQKS